MKTSDWTLTVENYRTLKGLSNCIMEERKADDAKAKLILTIDTSLYKHNLVIKMEFVELIISTIYQLPSICVVFCIINLYNFE